MAEPQVDQSASEDTPAPPVLRFDEAVMFNIWGSSEGTLAPPEFTQEVDFTETLSAGFGFISCHGGLIVTQPSPSRCELLPVIFKDEVPEAAKDLRHVFVDLFARLGVEEVWTTCPTDLPHVRAILTAMGFVLQFTRNAMIERGESWTNAEFYRLTVDEWIAGDSLLIDARAMYDSPEWSPPGDELEHAYTGFVALTQRHSNLERGVEVYNRWARLVGLGFIGIKAKAPVPSVQLEESPSVEIH